LGRVGGEVSARRAGAALAVDGRGRGLDGKAGREPGVAADVQALLADLADTAEDHVIDLARLNAGPVDKLLENHGAQYDWVEVLELAIPLAERRSDPLDDDRFTHEPASKTRKTLPGGEHHFAGGPAVARALPWSSPHPVEYGEPEDTERRVGRSPGDGGGWKPKNA